AAPGSAHEPAVVQSRELASRLPNRSLRSPSKGIIHALCRRYHDQLSQGLSEASSWGDPEGPPLGASPCVSHPRARQAADCPLARAATGDRAGGQQEAPAAARGSPTSPRGGAPSPSRAVGDADARPTRRLASVVPND